MTEDQTPACFLMKKFVDFGLRKTNLIKNDEV
jgi:hypothetical protein